VRVACAPEQRSAGLAKRIECPNKGEIPQGFLLQADACRELIERLERPAKLALAHDSLSFLFAEAFDAPESETDVMRAAFAM
jgi:hypothetical protein